MDEEAWILIPPLLTLTMAIVTRRVVLSLLAGCLSAAFIASGSFWGGINLFSLRLLETSQLLKCTSWSNFCASSNAVIALFVIFMGILIHLMERSGGAEAFQNAMNRFIKNKRSAEVASILLTHLVAFDGYICALMVGTVMRPLFDRYGSPRLMLAYISRSLTSPLCSINPLSTWIAPIMIQLSVAGITSQLTEKTAIVADPFYVYLQLLPFIFYSILSLAVVWMVVWRQISFGTTATAIAIDWEKIAATETNNGSNSNKNPRLLDFFFPIITMAVTTAVLITATGGWWLFGGTRTFFEALDHSVLIPSLLLSSVFVTLAYLIYLTKRGIITTRQCLPFVAVGSLRMLSVLTILLLAWTFGSLEIKDNAISTIIARQLPQEISMAYFPLFFFLLSSLVGTAIGSSWGTIALLFPIATATLLAFVASDVAHPVTIDALPILIPCLAAIISGAVCGDNLSPISDLAILVSATARCPYATHVVSQACYSLPIMVSTAIVYIIAGHLYQYGWAISSFLSLSTGLFLCYAFLATRKRLQSTVT